MPRVYPKTKRGFLLLECLERHTITGMSKLFWFHISKKIIISIDRFKNWWIDIPPISYVKAFILWAGAFSPIIVTFVIEKLFKFPFSMIKFAKDGSFSVMVIAIVLPATVFVTSLEKVSKVKSAWLIITGFALVLIAALEFAGLRLADDFNTYVINALTELSISKGRSYTYIKLQPSTIILSYWSWSLIIISVVYSFYVQVADDADKMKAEALREPSKEMQQLDALFNRAQKDTEGKP